MKGKDLDAIEKAQKDLEEATNTLVKELSSFKGRREETKKWAMELIEHISKCPVCEQGAGRKDKGHAAGAEEHCDKEVDPNRQGSRKA